MNILVITHYFPPHRGGIENVAFNQARLLAGLGNEVTVVSSRLPGNAQGFNDHFSVVRIAACNVLEQRLGVPYPLFHPSAFLALSREVARADVVNGHGHVYMPVVIGALLARMFRKPFVLTQHNTFIHYSSSILRGVQHVADMAVARLTTSSASEVVAVSNATRDYVKHITGREATVIYNGVDVTRFRPCDDRAGLRRDLAIPVEKIVCLCVRRMTYKNGIDTLLEVAELLGSRRDICFLIGGDGPDLPSVRKQVQERKLGNVTLLGPISDGELPDYYAAADMFVLPSSTGEGLPLVVLESLASGLPVIATRSGGHVEVIMDGELGYIVDSGDAAMIAGRIVWLSERQELIEHMGERCRQFAIDRLSWEYNVYQLVTVLERAKGQS